MESRKVNKDVEMFRWFRKSTTDAIVSEIKQEVEEENKEHMQSLGKPVAIALSRGAIKFEDMTRDERIYVAGMVRGCSFANVWSFEDCQYILNKLWESTERVIV